MADRLSDVATRSWQRPVPHWLVGSINLVLLAVVAVGLLAGRRALGTPYEGVLSIAFALSLFPGVIFAIWYLRAYRKASLFLWLTAWLTLIVCAGFISFSLLFIGA